MSMYPSAFLCFCTRHSLCRDVLVLKGNMADTEVVDLDLSADIAARNAHSKRLSVAFRVATTVL